MFRFSLATNDVLAWTRTRKSVLRILRRSNSVCLYRCKRREIHAVRAKNADCTCTHSTKNKIQRGWYFYSGFGFLSFFFVLAFFAIAIVKNLYYSGVTSRYILLHSVSSRTSRASGLRIQFIQHSSPIDYPNIWLESSQRHYFGLFKGMSLLCTLISTRLLYFLVG